MPCNSDYMESNQLEVHLSKVACLLDELAGKPWNFRDWNGYHPDVYGKASKAMGDKLTAELCTAIQKIDVTQYSLEMQIWWRNHQAADKKRIALELAQTKTEADRQAALSKLTDYERQLLGLSL